jgi:sigma-B regulation protein RsbU (phosphoserine phosphatase)
MSTPAPSAPDDYPSKGEDDALVSYAEQVHPDLEVGLADVPLVPPSGGDFSAAVPLPDGTVGVVLGDVVGHGPEAAEHAERLRDAVVGAMREGLPPQDALGFVNAAAEASPDFEGFATAFAAKVTPETGEVVYASGGHEPALIAAPGDAPDAVAELTTTGPPLGAVAGDEANYAAGTAHLPPGGTLLAYTDGVSEARRGGLFFGPERVRGLLVRFAGLPPVRLCRLLVGRARAFAGRGRRLRDDAAVLALRRAEGTPAPAATTSRDGVQ